MYAKTYVRTDLEEDINNTSRRLGFIAQELQAAIPNHIINVCSRGNDGLMRVDYLRLTTILWSATKKQQELIESLESRIQTLENNNKI